jgi:hypothetical protein
VLVVAAAVVGLAAEAAVVAAAGGATTIAAIRGSRANLAGSSFQSTKCSAQAAKYLSAANTKI